MVLWTTRYFLIELLNFLFLYFKGSLRTIPRQTDYKIKYEHILRMKSILQVHMKVILMTIHKFVPLRIIRLISLCFVALTVPYFHRSSFFVNSTFNIHIQKFEVLFIFISMKQSRKSCRMNHLSRVEFWRLLKLAFVFQFLNEFVVYWTVFFQRSLLYLWKAFSTYIRIFSLPQIN